MKRKICTTLVCSRRGLAVAKKTARPRLAGKIVKLLAATPVVFTAAEYAELLVRLK